MLPSFQSKQSIIISAPLKTVWEYNQDLSKISDFHPRVERVELISGKQYRGEGVSYQCHMIDGKNTCIEKDIEVVPMERIVTVLPADTMGITKLLPDYVVETTFHPVSDHSTRVEIRHYYTISKWYIRLLNLIIRPRIARQTSKMLMAMKDKIEIK